MKYLFLLIVTVVTITVFNACTEEIEVQEMFPDNSLSDGKIVLTQDELTSISFDDLTEVPEDKVFSMVTDFLNLQDDKAKTRDALNLKFNVKSKKYLGKKSSLEMTRSSEQEIEGTIPIYELTVEKDNQISYAFVSADNRAPGVLVLFNDFPTKKEEINEGLNHPNTKAVLALTQLQLVKTIEEVEQAQIELREKTIEKICAELNIPVSEYSFENIIDKINVDEKTITRNHAGTEMPSEQTVTKEGPLCKIAWDQYEPYNRACPIGTKFIPMDGNKGLFKELPVPAGCVAIACIGIEACLERTSIGGIPMNWAYYKSAKTLFEANEEQTGGTPPLELERAGKAIRYIYDQLYSYSQYKYGENIFTGEIVKYVSATAVNNPNGDDYIRRNFNYVNNGTLFDPDVVLSSLNERKPVYVTGTVWGDSPENPGTNHPEGHAFLIDGYIITQKAPLNTKSSSQNTRSTIVKYYDMYWHVNLGWGTNSNAYFKLDSDATCTPEFYDQYGRYNLVQLKNMNIISHISKK